MPFRKREGVEGIKILLVDDLKDNLIALDGLLRRDDVEILTAKSGTDALELMASNEFALALIDVHMPSMSGFELAELMRGTNRTRNIPIIFLSASAIGQSYSFKGYEMGAVDFLLKPLDTFAVKSKVNVFIELYSQKREQGKLLTDLTQTKGELERAVQIREDFMSIASHELKTPITSLMLQSQMRRRSLRKGESSTFTLEGLSEMFEDDEKQLERISRLIDDMLDITRISSGKLSMTLERCDLCELVRNAVKRSSEQFMAEECPIEIEVCEPAFGTWDPFRIEQVVTNLLTNAIRYGAGKLVSIRVETSSDKALITVRDRGRGIGKENHERIFQRFERAVAGSEISGLGLGLYIVSQIVEAHQGAVRLESELGQGARFTVELPLC